ncbi:MAG: hypothetical protein N3D85_00505 [Candidatus Bathyarchaeota archaeon]|nr:hypothetical protein [Candidatus Bathyarchaeota archaeon]
MADGRLEVDLPKYHVYIEYVNNKEKPEIKFNLTREELVRIIATPYNTGNPFWFCGKLVQPEKTARVVIFWSYEYCRKLALSNREEIANHPDKKVVID